MVWPVTNCFVFFEKLTAPPVISHIHLAKFKTLKQILSNSLTLNFYCLNIIHIRHQRYHSKNDRTYSKEISKRTSVCVHGITLLIIMKMKLKINHMIIDTT